MTTNDMPIADPISFTTLNLLPFQINPHYLDKNPNGFGGETRKDRITEFVTLNSKTYVLCLHEGSLLKIIGDKRELIGKSAFLFKHNKYIEHPIKLNSNLDFLFQK
ncbi:hypothetical protein FACS1894218_0410 [Bacilli bacterium]|nr:hypothetical protein FACS1894218_0410 [Bacilli bacterium]